MDKLDRLIHILLSRGVIVAAELEEEDVPDAEPAVLPAGAGYQLGQHINVGEEDAGRVHAIGIDERGRKYTEFIYNDGREPLRMYSDSD